MYHTTLFVILVITGVAIATHSSDTVFWKNDIIWAGKMYRSLASKSITHPYSCMGEGIYHSTSLRDEQLEVL